MIPDLKIGLGRAQINVDGRIFIAMVAVVLLTLSSLPTQALSSAPMTREPQDVISFGDQAGNTYLPLIFKNFKPDLPPASPTPTQTATPTMVIPTSTPTPTATATPTSTPMVTDTPPPTPTVTGTSTSTPTVTGTPTSTPTVTGTPTPTPTVTVGTPTPTLTVTADTPTSTPTVTRTPTPTPTTSSDWQTIFADGFEAAFPGPWQRFGNPGWGQANCRAYAGNNSVWPAAAGIGAMRPCLEEYPPNLNAWLVYGPFDLSNAIAAEVTFQRWQKVERDYDFFRWMASADGENFYGWQSSGNTEGWNFVTFDLSAVPALGDLRGRSQVWIAFNLRSDATVGDEGVFLDEVVIRKRLAAVVE